MIYDYDLDEKLKQGDIFNDVYFSSEKQFFFSVLINPLCDLVIQENKKSPKAKYLLFIGIINFDFILNNLLSNLRITKRQKRGLETIDSETYDDFVTALYQFINGDIYPRYYYLPPIDGYLSHSVLDFQFIESKKYSETLRDNLIEKKIATIKSSWKESIATRFSNYASRIGVRNDYDSIVDSILRDYKLEFQRN